MKTKKITALLIATLFLMNIFALAALADTSPSVTVTPTTGTNTATTPDSGQTPISPLYGLKILSEKVDLLLTDDPLKQATLYAQYAMERMNEANLLTNLTDQQKADLLQKLTQQYTQNIQKAQDLLKQAQAAGANIQELVVKLDQAQNIVGLKIILANLPEDARKKIELNLLKNIEGLDILKQTAKIEEEDKDDQQDSALEVILGQTMKNFVHAINDSRAAVHKAVEEKTDSLDKDKKKADHKALKDIEKQFKSDINQISKNVKSELVKDAQASGSEADIKAALDATVQKGIADIKTATDKALAAIKNYDPTAPVVDTSSANQQSTEKDQEVKENEGKEKIIKEHKEVNEKGQAKSGKKEKGEDD